MFHEKSAEGQGPRTCDPVRSWGLFIRYLEIGDDLYAVRHVDVFANGHALRYDRVHWVDDYGMLADMRYSSKWKKWWPSLLVEPAEFEEVWCAAETSPVRPLQIATARMSEMGESPVWLAMKRDSD